MSHAPWTATLPDQWSLQPLMATTSETSKTNLGMAEDNLLSLSHGNIIPKDIDGVDGLLPESFETYQIVEPGQIVCRFTDLQNDKRSLRTGLVKERGIITSAYVALTTSLEPRWLAYVLRSYDAQKVFYKLGGGLRQSIKYADIKRLPLITPPVNTQRSIADFLDAETAKIDRLIAKQELLVSTLIEHRAASIAHHVTKGRVSNIPMQASGQWWLGDVPKDWDLVPAGRMFAERKRGAQPDDEQLTASQSHGIIRQRDFIQLTGNSVTQVLLGADILKHVEPGDFVISMRSFQGGLELSRVRGKISSAYVMIEPTRPVYPGYYAWLFKSKPYITALQSTSNLVRDGQALRFANFAQITLPVPPHSVQKEIAAALDLEVQAIDELIARARQLIATFRERRTGLITAAVTGQVDVLNYREGA